MSGLSIGKNRASRFCQGAGAFATPVKTRGWEVNLSRSFVDGLLEALPGGERRQRLRVDLDLLAVHRAAPGARLALARQERAETDDRHALSFGDVLDDRFEHGVHRFARCCLAEVACLGCDLHEIRLGDDVWHALVLPASLAFVASYPNRIGKTMELGTRAGKAFMIT